MPFRIGGGRVLATAFVVTVVAVALGAVSALAAGPPVIISTTASQITSEAAVLEGVINASGKKTEYHFEYLDDAVYQANPESNRFAGAIRVPAPNKSIPAGEADVPVSPFPISGLSPATLFHLRLVAVHAGEGAVAGAETTFATYPVAFEGLPDGRAYEQASPVNKDGADVGGVSVAVRAARSGGKVTFFSLFGVPGGVGAESLPPYLASRGADWSTEGLLVPPNFGQTVRVKGWTPDFTRVFEVAVKFGEPKTEALLMRPEGGGPIVQIAPYTPEGNYVIAGSSADGSKVIFESSSQLPTTPPGIAGRSNVYAWDEDSGSLRLLSASNQVAAAAKEGSFAGPYDWVKGETPEALHQGGSRLTYYTQDQHAIAEDGSAFFTTAGTGRLLLRRNPTAAQSALIEKEGKQICSEPAKACTIELSESLKTNGSGPGDRDVAGPRPAAFMAATPDGSKAFFTSAEKLTNDATTGAEPEEATIGRAKVGDPGGSKEPGFIKAAAAGMTIAGEYLYWADAKAGTIGRAKLNGAGDPTAIDDKFIEPGLIEVKTGEQVPSRPQYVAVANGYVYWTDATDGLDKHGRIGRAKLGASEAEDVEREFIEGASNPQGIAVDASKIYWSNAGSGSGARGIGCAESGGGDVKQICLDLNSSGRIPEGLALNGSHLYWTMSSEFSATETNDFAQRANLDLDPESLVTRLIGENLHIRGVALDSGHLYWAEQGKAAIGRADLELSPGSVETNFLTAEGSLKGVAVDGEHIYWSANGETPPNPGNDLYRYDLSAYGTAQPALVDLTVDSKDPNGAEVKGVLGVSEDGSRLYFAANGDLDGEGPATPGTCKGPLGRGGECNLYLWEADGTPDGEISLIARLDTSGDGRHSDTSNWTGSLATAVFPGTEGFRKTAWVSADGQTLLFRSQQKLTSYDSKGTAELYRYSAGEGISCVSCNPTGAAPSGSPTLGSINTSALAPQDPAIVSTRNFTADGNRIFFESTDALAQGDTNGQVECPSVGSSAQGFPRCLDVYEWEAAGTGSCSEGAAAFSPLNDGCLYLISTGKSSWPSIFLDASESGDDAFFFTRQGLVGQDKDELVDVYDARVGGGIASQNQPPGPICESTDACHGPVPAPPPAEPAGSATFSGPANPKPKPKRAKHKHKGKKHHKGKKQHKGQAKGRASR
jgi:sugar lactone lactonase YvrE